MRLTLAVTAAQTAECDGLGLRLAYMAYRLSPSGLLLKSNALGSVRGGVMTVMGGENGDTAALTGAINAECALHGYEGVYLDFQRQTEFTAGLTAALRSRLAERETVLYGNFREEGVRTLFTGEVTGGSFALYVRETTERLGKEAILELAPLRVDFTLPSSGQGERISAARLALLLERAAVYYSSELMANYFTYQSKEGMTHFVLYDDARTLREKLNCAEREGIGEAFLPYGLVREELPDILGV